MTETTQDSLNVRLAKWAGWTNIEEWETWSDNGDVGWHSWKALRGTSPDGISEQWLPDYAGSLDAGMTLLNPTERQLQVVFRYSVYEQKSECMLLKYGVLAHNSHVLTAHGDTADDFALALARALDALRQQQEA